MNLLRRIDAFHCIMAALAALVVWAFVMVGVALSADSACLAKGYPRASVTVTFDRYCIKRVDQTDVVVPLR